ncbi:hypothetical protein HG537_0A02900 [Torulaspora globosa]|uniref:UBX domain-containing protein n=1 Tax=Torulaspora globosa TaxID=48254 RepID=A0A7H9HL79_9SACH|nr:hypothetical protein HG537_0A02900 [Torulaspora sp. CBS 2947]
MMDLIRRILHGGEVPFTPIPGSFPEEQLSGDNGNDEQTSQINERERFISRKRFFSLLLQVPFVFLYHFISLIILILSILSPLCAINGYYRKKQTRFLDPKSRLNNLLESLNNESQRTVVTESNDGMAYSFGSLYNLENGSLSQDIVQGSYTELLAACSEQCKFAIIYLHDPLLDNCMDYVNNILCSGKFTTMVRKYQIMLWFSDVTSSEGLQVANALKVRQFPFLGVLCLKAEQRIEVIGRMEGDARRYDPDHLENILSKGYSRLIQIRQQRQNIALQRIIREQQDSRFEQSLRADQQRQREQEAQRTREAEEQRRERQTRQWLLWRKSRLHPEPPNSADTCRVAIRIEGDGTRLIRKFDASLPVEEIYAYVELYTEGLLDSPETFTGNEPPSGYNHNFKFVLITPVPRTELDPAATIRDVPGLYPSGNIVMETLD